MRPITSPASLKNLFAVSVLLLIGVHAFAPVYDGVGYAIAGLGALVAGAAIALWGAKRTWHPLVLVVVTMAAYLVLSAPFVLRTGALGSVAPLPATLRDAAVGLVTSWKDLLTADVPVAGFESLLLVPFITALVASATAFSLVLRLRNVAFALIPAFALLLVAIGFGTYFSVAPITHGLVFAVTTIVWLTWVRAYSRAQQDLEIASDHTGAPRRSRLRPATLAIGSAMIVASSVVAVVAHGTVTSGDDRDVLRNHVEPPFDIHDYPSPLQSFRKYVRDYSDTVLFTVDGMPEGARVRLATVDYYDGVVYGVGATGDAGSGIFQRVGATIPAQVQGTRGTATVTVSDLGGVWVPDIGYLTKITYSGPRADELSRNTHYNRATGVAVTTARLTQGDSYTIEYVLPPVPTPQELASVPFETVTMPGVQNVPGTVVDFATSTSGSAPSDLARVTALAESLAGGGYFSHGLDGEPPSRSGHGSERIAALFTDDTMVGDDEQYAVAMALMARSLNIPARVVMGFYPESHPTGTYTVTADDLHVWVEVAFDGWGWVAMDPTPAENLTPPDEEQPPEREPKPQVLQPPPPPEDPVELPPGAPVEDEALSSRQSWADSLLTVAVYALIATGVLAVVLGPFIVIAASKANRRRHRKHAARPADRFTGAWDEVVDRVTDAGVKIEVRATRPEHARMLDAHFEAHSAVALARLADRGVFGPEEPSGEESAAFWQEIEDYLRQVDKSRGRRARLKSALSVRSLAARREAARSAAKLAKRKAKA